MSHDTPARQEARRLRAEASARAKEARILGRIEGGDDLALTKSEEAEKLLAEAHKLDDTARLEDTSVSRESYSRTNRSGERKVYYRWVGAWRKNGHIHRVYIGSCNRLTKEQAIERAKEKKAKALGLENG